MRLRILWLMVLSVAVLACSTPGPVKVVAGDQCHRCRRYIGDERIAGEAIIVGDRSNVVAKFREPGCMARYLVDHPDETRVVYVTDYTSGRMIRPSSALFVAEVVNANSGEKVYRAYDQEADAQTAAAELRTTPVSWETVLDNAH